MKKLTGLSLAILLMGATFTSCNNSSEKKDAAADSLKTTVDSTKPKVDSPITKVDSGSAPKPKPMVEVVGTKHN